MPPNVAATAIGTTRPNLLTEPVSIFAEMQDPDAPHPAGTPIPLGADVFNPSPSDTVHLTGLTLRWTISTGGTPVAAITLAALDADLPPMSACTVTVQWNQRASDGTAVPAGHMYQAQLHQASAAYRDDRGGGSWNVLPDPRRAEVWFSVTYPDGTAPQGDVYGTWRAADSTGAVTVTITGLVLQPARARVEGLLGARAYVGLTAIPDASAITGRGLVPLPNYGAGNLGSLLPNATYPQMMRFTIDFAPLPPGTSALRLTWPIQGEAPFHLDIPAADAGPLATVTDLAAIDRLAAALDATFPPPRAPEWDHAVLTWARASHHSAQAFVTTPAIATPLGFGPSEDDARALFLRLARAAFAEPQVQAFTFVTSWGVMRLTRSVWSQFGSTPPQGAALDAATGYPGAF